jgi:ATP adenylyltransferase
MPKPLWAPWRLEYVEHADERPGCIFCDPDTELVLARGTSAFLLLNRFPYSAGHLMAAPFRHGGDFAALTANELLEIHRLAASALRALAGEYAPDGYNLGWNLGRSAGAGVVDHVHLHVVPRWIGDTNFMPVLADTKVIPEALAATAERLRAHLAG